MKISSPLTARACPRSIRRTMVDPQNGATAPPTPATNRDGVDLTQIRALKAMTPSERIRALVATVNRLAHFKKNARRV